MGFSLVCCPLTGQCGAVCVWQQRALWGTTEEDREQGNLCSSVTSLCKPKLSHHTFPDTQTLCTFFYQVNAPSLSVTLYLGPCF